jgi:hypothetical protein
MAKVNLKLIKSLIIVFVRSKKNLNISSNLNVCFSFLSQEEVDDAKKLKSAKNGSAAHVDDESNGADENGAEEEEDLDEEDEEALGEEEEGDGEEDIDEAEGEEGEGNIFDT